MWQAGGLHLISLVVIRCMAEEAVTLKVTMRLTVFNSKPSSFSSHKEFQNAVAALLYYPPPHLLLVRLLCVCALATSQLPCEAHGSGNIYHIMC